MELERERALGLGHADAAVAPGPVDELRHPVDLERRIGRVGREHVVRDDRVAFHAIVQSSVARRSTSSVTSGRAKNRNGTNVVPVPGETCMTAAGGS